MSRVNCVDCNHLVSIGSYTCPKCGCIDPWRDKPVIRYDPKDPCNAEREAICERLRVERLEKEKIARDAKNREDSIGCTLMALIFIGAIALFYYAAFH